MTTPSSPATTASSGDLPSVPNWEGPTTGVASGSSSSSRAPGDIWNLGSYYNQPIYLGLQPFTDELNPTTGKQTGPAESLSWRSASATQEFNRFEKLWQHQQVEKAKSPDKLSSYEQLQQELYAAGMYGDTSYNDVKVGQFDTASKSAMKTALEGYVDAMRGDPTSPITFNEYLKQQASTDGDGGYFSQSGKGVGGAGSSGSVPQVQLTDPAAIRSAAQSAAQQALGQGLSDEQLNAFVSQFQAEQSSSQTSTGASQTDPDLSSQALTYAEQNDPQAYQNHQVQSYADTFLNMFLPSQSARPNMTPVASVGGS